MSKKLKQPAAVEGPSELEALAVRLDALAEEAKPLDKKVAERIGRAAKSARWSEQQRAARMKRVGNLVQAMQAKGLTPAQIVEQLTR